ncbi:MAG: restriction endonuclease [Candidatus Cloacimonetes bacterium HGW-Cloacimonetes-3]|jgi:hypothetical protein|nr:MAG: restriction endonuclease [Candidatus Cloacimonetes bacterium HGW-Cloacimonetes-3]
MNPDKKAKKRIDQAVKILTDLGMPKGQQNKRTGLCLLALLGLRPDVSFIEAHNPLMGITPIMDFSAKHYKTQYAPNSRETFRRQSIHQLVQAGLVLYNPDDDNRSTNSPQAVYQISPELLALVRQFDSDKWESALLEFSKTRQSLEEKYAKSRSMNRVPIMVNENEIHLSPGKHNELVKAIIEKFAPVFLHGAELVYVGDTQNKSAYVNKDLVKTIKIPFDEHNKFPDVVFYIVEKKWIVLIESVTSHGPMDSKRYVELSEMFNSDNYATVYVSAFKERATFAKYSSSIAWETEVWIEENPEHLIHYNGTKFLGPY